MRGGRAAIKGVGAGLDAFDMIASAVAFNFSDGIVIARTKKRLVQLSKLEGGSSIAQYVDAVEPFFKNVSEFIVDVAIMEGGMPDSDLEKFAIFAGFMGRDDGVNPYPVPIPLPPTDPYFDDILKPSYAGRA